MARASRFLVFTCALSSCTVFDGLTFIPDGGVEASIAAEAGTDAAGGADSAGGSGSAYAAAVLADRPVAYFRFEDGPSPTARDESGSGHDCEYVGAVQRGLPSATAGMGAAIGLGGDVGSHVLCSDAPFDFAGTETFSLEAWIRPRVADSIYRKVLSKDVDDPRSGYSLSVVQPGVVRAERYAGGAEVCGITANIRLDAWTHVAVTFDGAVIRLYVDGTPARDDCTGTPVPDTAAPLALGVQSDRRYGPFDGALDELAIYDHELSGDRVVAHRNAAQ